MLKLKPRLSQWTAGVSTTSKFAEETVYRIINDDITISVAVFRKLQTLDTEQINA